MYVNRRRLCGSIQKGSCLAAGAFVGYRLVVIGGFGGVALDLCLFQFSLNLRQTGACGNQLTDDDVLLQTGQRVDLALDGRFGQDTGGLLKDAADRKESLASAALVMPSSTC